jgi:hypothetical protein
VITEDSLPSKWWNHLFLHWASAPWVVELSLLPKNPTEAKLQAMSTRGKSTEPTEGVMKHTYKVVLYNYCLMQYCCILSYQLVHREGCCRCTRVQWVVVGNVSHKCGHVWLRSPMVGTMVNTFKSMCIELYLLPAVWGRSSALTLTPAEPRWSPF